MRFPEWLFPVVRLAGTGGYPLAVFLFFLPRQAPAFLCGLAIGFVHYLLLAGGFHWAMHGERTKRFGRLAVMVFLRLAIVAVLLVAAGQLGQFLAPLALVLGIFWLQLVLLVREVLGMFRKGTPNDG